MSNLKPLIVILGPTSSGKTELSLKLAKRYNGEIINADSRQVYRNMPIGTGSPILQIQNFVDSIPHYLFNIKNPNQKFSLSQYKKLAVRTINDIHKREKVPIVVGGTGLYISSIVDNLEIPKAPPNNNIRKKLGKHSNKYLFDHLKKVDSKSAKIIGELNKRKLIRSLEVYEITGKPFSSQQIKGKPLFNILQIGIKTKKEILYKKIDKRVDKMINDGLIKETKKLSKKYSFDMLALSGIGYLEISSYLKNEISLKEAIQKIKFRTHKYSRRQITWFKKNEKIMWVENYKEAKKLVKFFL